MDSGYLDDYKKKIELPKGTSDKSLTNTALAKKYFPKISKLSARLSRNKKKGSININLDKDTTLKKMQTD